MFVIGRHLGANVTAIAIILGLNLVITFLPNSNIAWQAHITASSASRPTATATSSQICVRRWRILRVLAKMRPTSRCRWRSTGERHA
jgi:hypothetical protein